MGTANRVHLLGRLTRDPETRTFQNGGKVAQFGFAVTGERRKDAAGEWEEVPCFIDCKAFNREHGRKLADVVENHCKKGKELYIEGHLVFEQWEKDGQKYSKLKVVVDDLQFVGKKEDDNGSSSSGYSSSRSKPDNEEDIPF